MTFPFSQDETEQIRRIKRTVETVVDKLPLNGFEGYFVITGSFINNELNNTGYRDVNIFLLNDSKTVPKIEYEMRRSALYSTHSVYFDEDYVGINPEIADSFVYDGTKLVFRPVFTTTKFASRKELVNTFDFEHCTMHYFNKVLYVSRNSYDATINKILVPRQGKYVSLDRIAKFKRRGYKSKSDDNPIQSK